MTMKSWTLDFSTIQTKVIQPYCISCHSSAGGNADGVNLENYSNVLHYIDKVQDTVAVRHSMPPGQPLSKGLQQLLVTWISNGSPEHTSQGAPPSTPPTPTEPLVATFTSISKNIFVPKCAVCHGAGGNTPITSYDFLKKGWVVANDLKSPLYLAINGGGMPPSEPLTQNEIDTIGAWITDGAKNN
jgi:mono/diheme cytochrome c family protein